MAFVVTVDRDVCVGCGECVNSCPADVLALVDEKSQAVNDDCIGCGTCETVCPTGAISVAEE